ncbi:aldose epimerase family protein [Arhodomonas sp. AD133]|uniref:aldose epimerase family protein n=1 Tax=Arhodomonas sp. AD133 TaxID=3415009 RepID=UPI003EBB19A7
MRSLSRTGIAGTLLVSAVGMAGGAAHAMSVTRAPFGTMPDGTRVDEYTLTNDAGMEVGVLTYGGIVQSVTVPDKNGEFEDVVLGFDRLEPYLDNAPYFGALIGRYGNRIAGGEFELGGETYRIPANNGPNALHGGPDGFDSRIWQARPIEGAEWVGVELSLLSRDGDMGFPGDLAVTVRYTLNQHNDLRIHYTALSDEPTVVNLTNHAYFNLAGAGEGDVLDQVAMINADRYTPVDETLIPTGRLAPVAQTPFDFRTPKAIGEQIRDDHVQLQRAEPEHGGYDHNWVLNTDGDLDALAARVVDPASGRALTFYTTEPGVQFYTSNFLDGSLAGKNGESYAHWGGFTLEAQHFPDAPNQSDFPSTRLEPGEPYHQTTVFHFSP